jgi:hypothetical protein
VIAAVAFALALAGTPGRSSTAADEASPKTRPKPGRAVLTVMDEVVERLLPKLLDSPADTAHRVSVKRGLIGLGAWSPPGGADFGASAPPLRLFPSAGLGQSLNVDPITGRSYFGPP